MNYLDLNKIVNSILSVTSPEKIILFGSRTRGDYNEESDLDLMIIDPSPFGKGRSRIQEITKIRNSLPRLRMSVDILLFDINEFEYRKDSINHIVASSLRKGKILYERSQAC